MAYPHLPIISQSRPKCQLLTLISPSITHLLHFQENIFMLFPHTVHPAWQELSRNTLGQPPYCLTAIFFFPWMAPTKHLAAAQLPGCLYDRCPTLSHTIQGNTIISFYSPPRHVPSFHTNPLSLVLYFDFKLFGEGIAFFCNFWSVSHSKILVLD